MIDDGQPAKREPIFHVPAAVLVLLAAMILVHLYPQGLSDEDDAWFIAATAFIPWRYVGSNALELPGGDVTAATSLLTHTFVHGDFTHLAFNAAWLLAFGGAVAKRSGTVRFLVFYCICAIAGALAFMAMNPGLMAPVVGASGAIAGLMAGALRIFFSAMDDGGISQMRDAPETIHMKTLWQTLLDRRMQLATIVWLGLNVVAVVGLTPGASGPIAWEAHIGGFIAGLLLFGWFDLANAKQNQPQPTLH